MVSTMTIIGDDDIRLCIYHVHCMYSVYFKHLLTPLNGGAVAQW